MGHVGPRDGDRIHAALVLILGLGALGLGVGVEGHSGQPAPANTQEIPARFAEIQIEVAPVAGGEATSRAVAAGPDRSTSARLAPAKGGIARGRAQPAKAVRLEKQIAESAGLLADLQDQEPVDLSGVGGSQFQGGINGSQYGNQYGSGGLGSRGSGLGGGGTGEGLGGLGSRGRGRSSRGGYFGGRSVGQHAARGQARGFVDDPARVYWPGHDTEAYDHRDDNPFKDSGDHPLSTFSIDVDTASYSNVRRYLRERQLPPADSVRVEELINYFGYDYEPPAGRQAPFSAHVEVTGCPWAPEHRLARIGLKGWELPADDRPAANLVFLLDVSGSMSPTHKLPLVKRAMALLVDQLDGDDRIAIVVYAGASGLVLEPTAGDRKQTIRDALQALHAGGSTNGGAGIRLAYDTAAANFIPGGVNRVILCTDGDFNVGTTSQGELVRLIEEEAKTGVFLTVLGFGMGNLKDSTLEQLADRGNGNYGYIDDLPEARKMLVDQVGGTLVTIAKDVKIQVEFNPAQVEAYRLVGYENRLLAAEDFNDDTKDAGEIGAGHTVTALYEIVPAGVRPSDAVAAPPSVDPLKYQAPMALADAADSGELFTLKLRFKRPDGQTSTKLEQAVVDGDASYAAASTDLKFAASVAMFGMLLRDSPHKGTTTYEAVLELAEEGVGTDRRGYRREFLELVRLAKELS